MAPPSGGPRLVLSVADWAVPPCSFVAGALLGVWDATLTRHCVLVRCGEGSPLRGPFAVASIDLACAFGSVSLRRARGGLERKGVGAGVRGWLAVRAGAPALVMGGLGGA